MKVLLYALDIVDGEVACQEKSTRHGSEGKGWSLQRRRGAR